MVLAKLRRGGGETLSRKTWKRYFEARVAVMVDWYGISEEEVRKLIAEKLDLGYHGDAVFEAVKKDLEMRATKILERR